MDIHFKDDCTLVIRPGNSVEAMALKYWEKEYEEHGEKMLEVDTEVAMRMPAPKRDDD